MLQEKSDPGGILAARWAADWEDTEAERTDYFFYVASRGRMVGPQINYATSIGSDFETAMYYLFHEEELREGAEFIWGDDDPRPYCCIPGSTGLIDSRTVRFSQNSVSGEFGDGMTLEYSAAQLLADPSHAANIPPVLAFFYQGELVSWDNRRLVAAQMAKPPSTFTLPRRMSTSR